MTDTPKQLSLTQMIRGAFMNTPVLESERLIYKRIQPENAEDMYEYSKLEEVTRYLLWTPHKMLKQTQNYIKLLQKKYELGAFWDFGLTHKESGRFIGTCGITSCDDEDGSVELGYVLSPDFWGMGLATEAAKTVADYCVENYPVKTLYVKLIKGNDASMRVAQKLGMTLEGEYKNSMFIKGRYRTICVFTVTREDYLEKRLRDKNGTVCI